MYTCGSLFTGIGGIDLAFVTAGCDILFQVEIDPYCTKVLEKHHDRYWPHATRFTDVREVGGHNLPRVDILFGGFPCQDLSLAGKRMGISEGTRSGLWFEFARLIGDLRPRVVLLENVPGILTLGGTIVIADLAQMGYVGHWGTLSAADAGAPHQRERWFCVAYATDHRYNSQSHEQKSVVLDFNGHVETDERRLGERRYSPTWGSGQAVGNPAGLRRKHYQPFARSAGKGKNDGRLLQLAGTGQRTVEPRLGGNFARVSYRLDRPLWPARPGEPQHAWEPPRVISGQPNRTARLKALGNSVVPAVVYPIACEIVAWLEAQAREESEVA